MRDIQADGRLVHMWRGMLRDVDNLMHHVVGATTLVTRLRRALRHYRHGQDAARQHPKSRDASSDDHDQGSDHPSLRAALYD